MGTMRPTATTWLSAVAAVIVLGVAGIPAVANEGHHHAKASTEKAAPEHHMTAGSGDTAMGDQAIVPATGATALLMPIMNPARGRKVFAAKGCVVCHAINGIGGNHGPPLDMSHMGAMNPFDFAAKMWEGAEAMIALQEEELGERISLTGQDLADMIAFVHNTAEIKKFSAKDVPHRIMDVYQRTHGKAHTH